MHWTFTIEGGPRRVNHAAVVIDNVIYSFGGYCSDQNSEVRKPMDVYAFDTTLYTWRCLPCQCSAEDMCYDVPYQRYGHTAVAYNKMCYIWGGRNDLDGACNALFQFDPRTEKWTRIATIGDVAPARDGHGACVHGDEMIIFGGFEEGYQRFSNDTYVLDFRNFRWRQLHPTGLAPQWRDFHTTTMIGDCMYVFGGRCDESGPFHTNLELYSDELMYLNVRTNSWHIVDPYGVPPIGRRSHSAWTLDGKLFIFGGYNGHVNEHYNDLYSFDPSTSKWSKLHVYGTGPKPRRRQCCVVLDRKVYLFGGTSPAPADPLTFPTDDLIWTERNLTDHSDLYVLDFMPDLKIICMMSVRNSPKLYSEIGRLPWPLRANLQLLSSDNKASVLRQDG